MREILIHQAIHGYDRGHRLLASSAKVPSGDADILARLSDLSGAMIPGLKVEPYLTFFPSGQYYAVSRTWLDESAPRTGCVFTHTLLLSREDWGGMRCPRLVEPFFKKPDRNAGFGDFQRPLSLEVTQPFRSKSPTAKASLISEFTVKFFANGQHPLVWCDCESAEDLAWSLLDFAWPSLRNWLSIGTFCLQPRTLADDLFQLMFAPSSARPRFHTLPKQAFIEGKSQEKDPREPWTSVVAHRLAQPNQPHPLETALAAVGNSIEPDPTITRNLFLLQELLTRLKQSPTAGIAVLDVLESLAPEPQQAAPLKAEVIVMAVGSAVALPCDEALKSLYLLNDRLGRKAFADARDYSLRQLREAVSHLATSALNTALIVVSDRQVLQASSDYSPFAEGLFDALEQLSNTDSDMAGQLVSLADFREFAREAVVARPEIARGYLRAARRVGENGAFIVAAWIANCNLEAKRRQFRIILLPEIHDDQDSGLAQEVLRDIVGDEVEYALTTLFESSDGFSAPALRETIIVQVAIPYPASVRNWAMTSKKWSFGAGQVASAPYGMDRDGLAALVSDWGPEHARSAYLHAGFLDRVLSSQRGAWLREFAKHDCTFLDSLLSLGATTPSELSAIIANVIIQCPEMPIARSVTLLPAIDQIARVNGLHVLGSAAVKSAIREFVHQEIDAQQMFAWHETTSGSNWLWSCPSWELADFLNQVTRSTDDWNRLWQWLVVVPRALYQRSPSGTADTLRTLYLSRHSYWTDITTHDWSRVLGRSRELSEPAAHLLACAESLHFAFEHTWLPLSSVVVQAFGDVYSAVADKNVVPNEVSCLFGFMDWDKAKSSRNGGRFYGSRRGGDWRSETAVENSRLRKVFKRLKRKWHGDRFIRSMIDDLAARNDESSMNALAILTRMINGPDFYEPWD